jgi:hypothetical protein
MTTPRFAVARRKARLRAATAALFTLVTVVTAVWPDWLEVVIGIDPDNGDGSLEWGFVATFAFLAFVNSLGSWRAYRLVDASG